MIDVENAKKKFFCKTLLSTTIMPTIFINLDRIFVHVIIDCFISFIVHYEI